jgi:hypothetical protein
MNNREFKKFVQDNPHEEFKRLALKLKLTADKDKNRRRLNNASLKVKVQFKHAILEQAVQSFNRLT